MFNVRGTTKFRKLLGASADTDPAESTTTLGDWYANIVYVRSHRLVLCTSEESLLSVVFTGRQLPRDFGDNFRRSVKTVLRAIGVPDTTIRHELDQMNDYVVTRTENRSVLGSMNDFAFHMKIRLPELGIDSLDALSLELSGIPCGPLSYDTPDRKTWKLFAAAT